MRYIAVIFILFALVACTSTYEQKVIIPEEESAINEAPNGEEAPPEADEEQEEAPQEPEEGPSDESDELQPEQPVIPVNVKRNLSEEEERYKEMNAKGLIDFSTITARQCTALIETWRNNQRKAEDQLEEANNDFDDAQVSYDEALAAYEAAKQGANPAKIDSAKYTLDREQEELEDWEDFLEDKQELFDKTVYTYDTVKTECKKLQVVV